VSSTRASKDQLVTATPAPLPVSAAVANQSAVTVGFSASFVIEYNQLIFGNEIDKGTFGTVYRGTLKWNGQIVAIKQLHRVNQQTIADFRAENEMLKETRRLSLKHVVGYLGYAENLNPPSYNIVMEFVPGGNADNFIEKYCFLPKIIPLKTCYKLSVKMISAVKELHAAGIVHKDIKPGNFLLTENGDVKLADFGLAVKLDKAKSRVSGPQGTPGFMAPEIITKSEFSKATDMYAFGSTLYMMAGEGEPFEYLNNAMQILWTVRQGKQPPISPHCPPKLAELINLCWQAQPAQRQNAEYLYKELEKLQTAAEKDESNIDASSPAEFEQQFQTALMSYQIESFDELTKVSNRLTKENHAKFYMLQKEKMTDLFFSELTQVQAQEKYNSYIQLFYTAVPENKWDEFIDSLSADRLAIFVALTAEAIEQYDFPQKKRGENAYYQLLSNKKMHGIIEKLSARKKAVISATLSREVNLYQVKNQCDTHSALIEGNPAYRSFRYFELSTRLNPQAINCIALASYYAHADVLDTEKALHFLNIAFGLISDDALLIRLKSCVDALSNQDSNLVAKARANVINTLFGNDKYLFLTKQLVGLTTPDQQAFMQGEGLKQYYYCVGNTSDYLKVWVVLNDDFDFNLIPGREVQYQIKTDDDLTILLSNRPLAIKMKLLNCLYPDYNVLPYLIKSNDAELKKTFFESMAQRFIDDWWQGRHPVHKLLYGMLFYPELAPYFTLTDALLESLCATNDIANSTMSRMLVHALVVKQENLSKRFMEIYANVLQLLRLRDAYDNPSTQLIALTEVGCRKEMSWFGSYHNDKFIVPAPGKITNLGDWIICIKLLSPEKLLEVYNENSAVINEFIWKSLCLQNGNDEFLSAIDRAMPPCIVPQLVASGSDKQLQKFTRLVNKNDALLADKLSQSGCEALYCLLSTERIKLSLLGNASQLEHLSEEFCDSLIAEDAIDGLVKKIKLYEFVCDVTNTYQYCYDLALLYVNAEKNFDKAILLLQRASFLATDDDDKAKVANLLQEIDKKLLSADERYQLDRTVIIIAFLRGEQHSIPIVALCDILIAIKNEDSLYLLLNATKGSINKFIPAVSELKIFLHTTHDVIHVEMARNLYLDIFIIHNKKLITFDFLVNLDAAVPSSMREIFLKNIQDHSPAEALAQFLVYDGDIKELGRIKLHLIEDDALFEKAVHVARSPSMFGHLIGLKIKYIREKVYVDKDAKIVADLLVLSIMRIIGSNISVSISGIENGDALKLFTSALTTVPSRHYASMIHALKEQVRNLSGQPHRNKLFSHSEHAPEKSQEVMLAATPVQMIKKYW